MSVEIQFPLEFVVEGTTVSLQAKRRESIDRWKSRIVEASRPVLPEGHFATEAPLAITLFYFPDAEMEGGPRQYREADTRRAEQACLYG